MGRSTAKALLQTIMFNFINDILDEMDKYLEMKGFWLIMDNTPIHRLQRLPQDTEEGCGVSE